MGVSAKDTVMSSPAENKRSRRHNTDTVDAKPVVVAETEEGRDNSPSDAVPREKVDVDEVSKLNFKKARRKRKASTNDANSQHNDNGGIDNHIGSFY